MMDSSRFCLLEWVLKDTEHHSRHAQGSSQGQELELKFQLLEYDKKEKK